MIAGIRQGVAAKQKLTTQDQADLQRLAELCNAHEHLLMRLDYNAVALPLLPTNDFFLFYDGGQLVGCLLLDRYHSDTKEVNSMVHPAYRRRGICRRLLAAACEECQSRGIRRLLFACETTSGSGQAFVQAVGAVREFAEHRMLLQNMHLRFQHDDHLCVREAGPDDLEKLAIILATDFDGSEEQAARHVLRVWQRPNQCIYIATYGTKALGCAEPVGTVRVEEVPAEFGLYGFFVRPEYRGRGHGRQIMEEVLATIRESSQKPVMLEVDSDNIVALNLYRSCGFVVERTYEYYGLNLI
jgi:ribosomal protein S18 acetylase RimI-like enzyme